MTNLLAWIRSHKSHVIAWVLAVLVFVLAIASRSPFNNRTQMILWLAMGAAIVILTGFLYSAIEPPGSGEGPMPRGKRIFLMAYLLIFGAGLVLMLIGLASMDFPDTPLRLQETAAATATPTPTSAQTQTAAGAQTQGAAATPTQPAPAATPVAPVVVRVFPESSGEPPTQHLSVYGRNFKKDRSKIRFNGKKGVTEFLADNLLKRDLPAEAIVGRGAVMVEVVNENDDNTDGPVSNAISVPIEKPSVALHVIFFWRFWEPWLTREMQLMLMVICAGALGSYLHAVMSIADFIGGRKLVVSWFWWYLTRPFLGMALGLVFYAVLRGGFLVGTPADEKFVNPFGVIAIGALVGMFSDKASQKLSEIFDVVFRNANQRIDQLNPGSASGQQAAAAAVLSIVDPESLPAGSPDTVVKIVGENLATAAKVKVNDVERAAAATATDVSFTITAAEMAAPATLKLTVLDNAGNVMGTAEFAVT